MNHILISGGWEAWSRSLQTYLREKVNDAELDIWKMPSSVYSISRAASCNAPSLSMKMEGVRDENFDSPVHVPEGSVTLVLCRVRCRRHVVSWRLCHRAGSTRWLVIVWLDCAACLLRDSGSQCETCKEEHCEFVKVPTEYVKQWI